MYLTIKLIHIISATLLFGTGLGSAFYMYQIYRQGYMKAMEIVNKQVVLADFLFTTPTIIIQLLSGLWLFHYTGLPWTNLWLWLVLGLFGFIGLCWLPVVWLQIKLTKIAQQLTAPSHDYHRKMRRWLILGLLAFPATLLLYVLMVFKPFFIQG